MHWTAQNSGLVTTHTVADGSCVADPPGA